MVRSAAQEDVAQLRAWEAEIFGADAWPEGQIPLEATLVATREDGLTAGYVVATVAGDVADLQRLAVSPQHRRQGVAASLLVEAVRRCRGLGAHRMLLEVREDNHAALNFYAERGFVQIDRRRRYYRDGADALVLRLPLTSGCGGRR